MTLFNPNQGGGGGGGTPGTPVNSVQFNNPLGTFAGDIDFTFVYNQSTGGSTFDQRILNFSQGIEVGSNGIINGTFFGTAAGWTLTNVVYSSNAVNFTATGSGGTASIVQQGIGGFVPLRLYPYSYTVTNYSGDKYHYFNSTTGGSGAKRQGNGTFTGWLLMSTNDYFSVNLGGGTVTTTMTVDDVSFKNPQAVNADDVLLAPRFFQNGYSVIDSNSIGSQSVAHATTADSLSGALTSPLTVSAGDENATLQMNTTAGSSYYLSLFGDANINGGLVFGIKDQSQSIGPLPTFGMSANFNLYSGPLTATLTMGDINTPNYNNWASLSYGSFAYTTDTGNFSFTSTLGSGAANINVDGNGLFARDIQSTDQSNTYGLVLWDGTLSQNVRYQSVAGALVGTPI